MINKERLLATFLDYVRIDSESRNEAAFAARVAEDLKEIGCEVYIDSTQEKTESTAGNVYATLPGTVEGEALVFSAHMDTVIPGIGIEPVVEDGVIRSKGGTVLGSDDKSGIAAVVEMLRTVRENNIPHPTLQAVFTVCEEIGLRGSKAVEPDKLAGKQVFVLDSDGDAGCIVAAAPGQYKLRATVHGRRAHAGVAPEEGVSAILVLAEAIANMKQMRIDEETTANVGYIHADFPTNIVSDRAEMLAECRSRNGEKLEAQAKHMVDCLQKACDKYGATFESTLTKSYSAYSFTEADGIVKKVTAACKKVGIPAKLIASGGGSDANVFNGVGVEAVDLGTGMAKFHTTEEFITVENLEKLAELVLAIATA